MDAREREWMRGRENGCDGLRERDGQGGVEGLLHSDYIIYIIIADINIIADV